MQPVLVLGAGKIGPVVAFLLANSDDYLVYLADQNITNRPDLDQIASASPNVKIISLNAQNPDQIGQFLEKHSIKALVSALPYFFNPPIAEIAKKHSVTYLDLSEDVTTAAAITKLSHGSKVTFVPQCGLAPGFISIVANDLMSRFPVLDTVKMRVGALPTNASNELKYALTWSTDGLINEYGNLCHAIENGVEVAKFPLDDLEEIELDGLPYEAFNTSGGIGSLATSYSGKVRNVSYKTMRYPGHCAKIRFLMNDLKLNHDRETLKRILENAIPRTHQDVVLVYVSVTGTQHNLFYEENYFKKFYPKVIKGICCSSIQLTTACGICAVLDLVLSNPKKYSGLVRQEQFTLAEFLNNRFGQYYAA